MRILKQGLANFFRSAFPIILIFSLVVIFFWKTIFLSKIPLPADFIVGTYYPWLDYKWGYETGVPVKNPITSDVVSVIFPLRMYAVDLIKQGIEPLWNPLMFGGYPLFANYQVAMLSPTFAYYLLFDKISAWSLQVITQPFLAAIFSYFLFRHFKLGKLESMFGGLIYAFSGFSIIWLEWNAHSLVAAWLPLIILIASRLIDGISFRWLVILSLVIAMQIFSGYPQLLLYSLLCLILLLIVRLNELSFRNAFMIGLFAFLGVMLTSIQTLPALELFVHSQRGREVLSSDLIYLPWKNLITFIVPDFFGNHATGNYWGLGNYTNNAGYSSAVGMVLAAYGIISLWKTWQVRYFLALFVLSLLFSLPNPVSKLIVESGVFGLQAASTTRILVVTNLSIAALSSYGLKLFLEKKDSKILFLTLIFLIGLAVLILLNQGNNVAFRNLLIPSVLVAVLFLLLNASRFKYFTFSRQVFGYMLFLLTVVELFRFGWKYTPFSDREWIYPSTPITEYLQNIDKPYRLFSGEVIPMNMWVPYGISSFSGYDAVYPENISKFIAVANSEDVDATRMGRHGTVYNFDNKLFGIANVSYGLFLNETGNKDYIPKESYGNPVFSDKSVSIYKSPWFLERAWLFYDWKVIDDEKSVLDELLGSKLDISKTLILNEEPGIKSTDVNGDYYLDIGYMAANRLEIYIDTKNPGMLFLSDTYYPGWNAVLDGRKTKLYQANSVFRAIEVPTGSHFIEFIYDPASFKIGKWISFVTLLLLLTVLYGEKYKGSKKVA